MVLSSHQNIFEKMRKKTGGSSRPNYIFLAPAPAALSTLVSALAIAPTPDLPC
jgi:hypothetical protein